MNGDEKLKLQKDLLWGLYQEYRNHARHNEILRSNIINYLILVSAGLTTLIATDKNLDNQDLPLTVTLMVVGFLGALFSASHTERYQRNRTRAAELRKELDTVWFNEKKRIENIKERADEIHQGYKIFKIINVTSNSHVLWLILPLFISLIGLITTIFVIYKK